MSGRNYKIYNTTTCHCCKIYDLRYIRSLIYSQHVALKDLWHNLNNVWLPHSCSNTTINISSQWSEQYQTKKNRISTVGDSDDQVRPHRMSTRPKVILWPYPWLSSLSRDGLPRLDPTVVFLVRLIARNARFWVPCTLWIKFVLNINNLSAISCQKLNLNCGLLIMKINSNTIINTRKLEKPIVIRKRIYLSCLFFFYI